MSTNKNRQKRDAQLRWIPLGKTKVHPNAQRKLRKAWVDELASDFRLEEIGTPTVHASGNGFYNIIDGQHRIEALKHWLGDGWESQQIQCWVYDELNGKDQAEKFLNLNNTKSVSAFDKFRVAVTAGRPVETAVNKVVNDEGLVVAQGKNHGHVSAVGSLCKVYRRSDGDTLARTLRIIRDGLGDAGFDASVIDGIGHLCQRYNGQLNDHVAVERLGNVHAGVSGLMAKAEVLRKQTGHSKPACIAAAAVDIINGGKGGKKLPSWWKS